jgi:hypothetical protein
MINLFATDNILLLRSRSFAHSNHVPKYTMARHENHQWKILLPRLLCSGIHTLQKTVAQLIRLRSYRHRKVATLQQIMAQHDLSLAAVISVQYVAMEINQCRRIDSREPVLAVADDFRELVPAVKAGEEPAVAQHGSFGVWEGGAAETDDDTVFADVGRGVDFVGV